MPRILASGGGAGIAGLAQSVGATLKIAGGVILPTDRAHNVDTEAMSAADDVDTIDATNAAPGDVLIMQQQDATRVVTIRNGMGNIITDTGSNLNLLNTTRSVVCTWNGLVWSVERYNG